MPKRTNRAYRLKLKTLHAPAAQIGRGLIMKAGVKMKTSGRIISVVMFVPVCLAYAVGYFAYVITWGLKEGWNELK